MDAGLEHQDKVAQYLYNCPEYLETVFACFKAALVPVNTNYRYVDDELVYLWDNADVVAVVFHGAFSESSPACATGCPGCGLWLWVDDGSGPCPEWAAPYETPRPRAGGRALAVGPLARRPLARSTPAGPPGRPRASCGARKTSSSTATAPPR